jgi:hypothetical protein
VAKRVQVEFVNDAERTLEWPAEGPLPALGYRVEIEGEAFEIVSVVLAVWPRSAPGDFLVTLRLKAAFTA